MISGTTSEISTKKLIFFGNERLVSGLKSTKAPILRGLIDHGYNVVAVVANHSDTRSRNARELEVAAIAREYDIPLLMPANPTDIIDELKTFDADAAVLVAYGRIIPQKVIDIFPLGIINIHPSLLPKLRGPTPLETAILSGEKTSGISIMQLSAGMDSGPVFAQESFEISESDDKFSLYEKAEKIGTELFFSTLPGILDGTIVAKPQNNEKALYSSLLKKSYGLLDPAATSAEYAEKCVRAFLGFPKTKVRIDDFLIIVTKAHVSTERSSPLDIAFSDKRFLTVDALIAPNGKAMSGESFMRGYLREK